MNLKGWCCPTLSVLSALASYLTIYTLNPNTSGVLYLLTTIVLVSMTTGAVAISDFDDIEKDRFNHPERPLSSGRLLPPSAWRIAVLHQGCPGGDIWGI